MLGLLLNDEHHIAAGVVLEIVARQVLEAAVDGDLRQQIDAIVLEAPEIVIVDGRQGPWTADHIVELGVMRIPPVVVVLYIEFECIARRIVDLARHQSLVALVVGNGGQLRLREIQQRIGMFNVRGEGQIIGKIVAVLAPHRGDFVVAAPIGAARLVLIVHNRLESRRLIVRCVDDEMIAANRVSVVAVVLLRLIGVVAER